ncbi:MAG: adenine deaminase [Tannerellaceae bacterium]
MNNELKQITGNIVDLVSKEIYGATITIDGGKITNIERTGKDEGHFLMPGFIDGHVHIESSMTTPSNFAKAAVKHGTIGVVTDPHEIANVMGIEGIDYMIENAEGIPFYFCFGAPSCVPATPFETAGAKLEAGDIEKLMQRDDIHFLAEVMNFPAVVYNDADMHAKLNAAKANNKPIDGHIPGIDGELLKKYIACGITTDHECATLEEAIEKCDLGMKIQIREGSAAKNFEALHPLFKDHADMTMLCSDDLHPANLKEGHINLLVKRALDKGYNVFDVLRAASYNAIKHYNMKAGLLQQGDNADFIVVDNLKDLHVLSTYVKGECVFDGKESKIIAPVSKVINNFNIEKIDEKDLAVYPETNRIKVIRCFDGDLITECEIHDATVVNDNVVSNVEEDILKIVVVNRYVQSKPAIGFIKGVGLKRGACAVSIAHDSHNIIAVGCSDHEICKAINAIIESKGGISVIDGGETTLLPLEIGGIISSKEIDEIDSLYEACNKKIKAIGSTLHAPQMTLSFMSLLVIPKIKIGDKGLFDVTKFEFTSLFES